MSYLHWTWRQGDSRWFLICLIILSFFLLCREIISSWYFIYLGILIVFFVLLCFIYKLVENKKRLSPATFSDELRKKYPVIIQYAPPMWLNPAEAWLLYNLKVDITDLTSLIYQWKFEWLIDVSIFTWEKSKKQFVKLVKKSDMPLMRPSFETEIFDSIFASRDVKIIEESFQLRYALMLEDLEYHWIRKWWIVRSELSKWWKYAHNIVVTLLFFCLLLVLFDVFVIFSKILWIVLCLLLFSSVILSWYISNWWKLEFTDKWAQLASQVIGYRNFIKSCDENRVKSFLKQDPLFIDRTLPYATAFGLETEFLDKITPLRSDWNAKYVRWKKIPTWTSVLRMLIWSKDNPWF